MNDDYVEQIKSKFGLNQYEAKIWLSLLSKGIGAAGEISAESNVPRSRAYDVMESLEKKGFVILKMSKPIKYMAVNPMDVIENLKKNAITKAQKHSDALEEFKSSEAFKELSLHYNSGVKSIEPSEMSGMVKGRNNIYSKIESMIRNSSKSIILSASPNDIAGMAHLKSELSKAKKRGVGVKILAPESSNILNALNGEAFGIKNSINGFSRFLITDDSDILFLLSNDDEVHPRHDAGLWVKSPSFAKSVNTMFNHMWERLN
ncbi:MAG: helix-turn-helix domain-containing protein [Candidatus Gastranaerophilales bacterium]|nr:helix-turn-helix domain-containing protein [Candidatus Gastranaerophilales bacterium]